MNSSPPPPNLFFYSNDKNKMSSIEWVIPYLIILAYAESVVALPLVFWPCFKMVAQNPHSLYFN